MQQIYGVELSTGAITAITDHVLPGHQGLAEQGIGRSVSGHLDGCDVFKVRRRPGDQQVGLFGTGVTCDGKQVLGIYIGDAESSTFWRQVLHDLQIRGVRDILIACIDNLTGLADVIQDMYPATDVQLCLVHQMRNSSKYITNKDLKPTDAGSEEDIPGYKY